MFFSEELHFMNRKKHVYELHKSHTVVVWIYQGGCGDLGKIFTLLITSVANDLYRPIGKQHKCLHSGTISSAVLVLAIWDNV